MVVLAIIMATSCSVWRIAMVYLFAAVLLSSTAHPWYLLWALALLPLRFNSALWVLSLTISWSYTVLIDANTWYLPTWVMVITYAPVYLVLTIELGYWRLKRRQQLQEQIAGGQ